MTNKEVKTETWLNLTPPHTINEYFTPIQLGLKSRENSKNYTLIGSDSVSLRIGFGSAGQSQFGTVTLDYLTMMAMYGSVVGVVAVVVYG